LAHRSSIGACWQYSVNSYRTRYIFEALFAYVFKADIKLALSIFLDASRNANSTRFGQAFQARGNINAVAEDIPRINQNVSHVDAYSKVDSAILGNDGITRRYFLLDFDSAKSGVNRAGKLNESGIAGRINNAAAMFFRL
jgi:hypothetical protein